MRVGIVGWFGSDNLGDEILLHSLITCVRAVKENASFVVFCPNPERVAELHGVQTENMPVLRARGASERQVAVQRSIKSCDLLLLGPGTVFQERSPNLSWPGTLPMFARIIAMAKIAGTPVATVGVGVREGGTPFGRQLLRVIGAACVGVGVRDERTASHFGSSAEVIGDMAYTLPLPELERVDSGRRFALSMRPLAPELEGPLLTATSGCAARLVQEGWSGTFLPMAFGRGAHGEDDRVIYDRAFRDLLALDQTPLDGSQPLAGALRTWLQALATNQLVLGTRLHAALLAVAIGVPTVAIAYERKVLDAFVDLGLSEYVVPPDVDADTLYRKATQAAAATEEFREAAARVAAQGRVAQGFVTTLLKRLG
ncbi:polysaccharide pyruvyl transferase WcaK-like protein [Micromonospora violae]|uniref:Polysaccharide pyruvyl transferase WcaK-like protein n=1 Tax=Micromonospora violae TaxID=1278207 RepID=A0A4Q7USK0_9ACTN|nr:polysaccharide pyruvyl transferase family protein [Micromonospora violae]RZT82923.1 polysaccharide pyruvyl transferase WcaK-like protein [Micromonospora violae]